MYPRICPLWCSSKGGCHWVIISEFDLAEPTKPKGGPDGATKFTLLKYYCGIK